MKLARDSTGRCQRHGGFKRRRIGERNTPVTPKEEAPEAEIVADSAPRRPTRFPRPVKLKREEPDIGLIRCPVVECRSGVNTSERGCNLATCRARHADMQEGATGFCYFCVHCRTIRPGGEPCGRCPQRNTREARDRALRSRNEEAAKNPIDLASDMTRASASHKKTTMSRQ